MFKHPLLQTDVSALSGAAIQQGLALVKAFHNRVTDVHVSPESHGVICRTEMPESLRRQHQDRRGDLTVIASHGRKDMKSFGPGRETPGTGLCAKAGAGVSLSCALATGRISARLSWPVQGGKSGQKKPQKGRDDDAM